jgi:HK97 family phage portal protein
MKLPDALRSFFSLETMAPRRELTATFEDQVAARIARRTFNGPFLTPSVKQALGVPAVLRAVSLIANTTGSLVMEAYKGGIKLPQDQAPNIIVRPNPRTTPRAFYRDSAYYLASRGECWWWVAKRDSYGNALSLVVVPPWEVTVQPNMSDRLRPTIYWLTEQIPIQDMRQITYLPDDDNLYRGVGPLQLCGAAASVAVEAQTFAANYFAGGPASTLVRVNYETNPTADTDGNSELQRLALQWAEHDPGLPRFVDANFEEVKDIGPEPSKAQMTETRTYSNGDAARMFGVPGRLLEYAQSGTTVTYANSQDLWREFQQGCLSPNYLEPIEQEMSDLLTRSTVGRFNLKGLLRADPKTRAEVYNTLIPLGVMTPEAAAQEEGYTPGDAEYAPVPFAPPQAIPARLPIRSASRDSLIRCSNCHRILGDPITPPYRIQCPRCKTMNAA